MLHPPFFIQKIMLEFPYRAVAPALEIALQPQCGVNIPVVPAGRQARAFARPSFHRAIV